MLSRSNARVAGRLSLVRAPLLLGVVMTMTACRFDRDKLRAVRDGSADQASDAPNGPKADTPTGEPRLDAGDGGGQDTGGGEVPDAKSDTGGAETPKDMPGAEPAIDMPAPDMPPTACNPVAATGCGSGQKCTLDCASKSITCLPAGTLKKGATCSGGDAGETMCSSGTTCACDTAKVCKCYEFCNGDGDCTAPETCRGNLSCTGDPVGTVRAKICA